MKKISILIILLLIASMLSLSVFAAQSATVTVSASNSSLSSGDTFTVSIDFPTIANCIAGGFMFEYDTDVFEYVSGKATVTGFSAAGVSTANGNLAGYFMGNSATVEGSVFQITLKVKDSAPVGNYTVSGVANIVTETNGVQEKVSCTVSNAKIAVVPKHVCTPGDVVIENMNDSTWQAVGTYDEVIYCTGCNKEISRVTKKALLNPFYNNAMELSSKLTLHVVIKINTLGFNNDMDAVKASGYYAVVTRIDEDGKPVETTIPASAWESHTKERMRIPYDSWNPTQMADVLEIVLYNDQNEAISVAYETSVRAVAMNEIKQAIAAGNLADYATMLVDMLNYGAASQKRFTYNEDDYANALLTEEMKGYATQEVVYSAKKDNSGAAVYQSTAMELGSRVELQLVLWNDAFGVDLSQVVAEISYTTFKGQLVTKTVDGGDFSGHTVKNGRERSKLIIDWLDIPDCKQDVTIIFKDLQGNVISTVTESMISAIGTYLGAYPDVELYPAMIKFINSAYARFS